MSRLDGTQSGKKIWALTWPQILMFLCQFAVGITDVWACGRLGANVQAAMGLVAQCQFFLMILAFAGTSGTIASISQSLGAARADKARRYAWLSVGFGFAAASGLSLAAAGFDREILKLINTPPDIAEQAAVFFRVCLWTLPGQYMLTLGGAACRAFQSVHVPLYAAVLSMVLNFLGDMAFGLGWWGMPAFGVEGVAVSSLVSVSVSALLLVMLMLRQRILTVETVPGIRWLRVGCPYFFRVALPSCGTSALWQSGYMVLFIIAAALPGAGVEALGGLTAGNRIESVLFLPAVACGMTTSVLVGNAVGRGKHYEARRIVLIMLFWSSVCMSLAGAAVLLWRTELAAFMAPDVRVCAAASCYLLYNVFSIPFSVGSIILAHAMNGAGASVYPLAAFSLSVWGVRLPLAWILGIGMDCGYAGIFISMLLSQGVQMLFLLWVFFCRDWMAYAMRRAS